MPDYPRDYDPKGRQAMHRLPPPPAQPEPEGPYVVAARPVFGRKAVPIVSAPMEPICPTECRMVEFGTCEGKCRLMATSEKEEPTWLTPKSS